ncbi:MAG: precorrin-3B C(17)-methyltransferase [Deltaproteobacteria bacterium]|nr:MAG: precorrin-3B C(17)-methyltransferase [Desulfobacterium sp. 4572_20]RLB16489.1 MAG: precorrin-3B C(17)-methyltransferase [Deltaproteobacteria bacterium]RLB25782.1 MAG: precorrin-3B C(17)-methyltransferase [Deltaproteobacteria bacterium]RLJ05107.1 MAG: precorrin-3B C(17)-methyltransferase [Candidatus Aenigmarchaeota archaeon]HDH87607.1 precorrin-3B C(17)-methyltransferase [Desulfobacteraceae bacterium]
MRGNSPAQSRDRQTSRPQDKEQKCNGGNSPGKLTIVSLGPGNSDYLTPRARNALMKAEVIVGYRTYMELIEPVLLKGKETISTGMTQEIQRSQFAIDMAIDGKDTAIISSGDAGIYGMAGLVLEILSKRKTLDKIDLEIIPGIPALAAASALLGAPLMHDFAVISLSDLMTPWEVIQSRVKATARADFVLVIYNPKSQKRNWQLGRIRDLILKYRSKYTPVGIVRNAMREGQSIHITTLDNLDESLVDMLSIVIIGNSRTKIVGGKIVTPRGYMEKYKREGKVSNEKGNSIWNRCRAGRSGSHYGKGSAGS